MINSPLVQKVTSAKEAYQKVHDELLAQCRDKRYDLSDRFETWQNLITKVDHPYVYHFNKEDTPKCIKDYDDGLECKYETHHYSSLIDYAIDNAEEGGVEWVPPVVDWVKEPGKALMLWNLSKEEFMNTNIDMIELREWLIQENFGSFKFDW